MADYPITLGNTALAGSSRRGELSGSFSLDYDKETSEQTIIFEAKTPTSLKTVYSAVSTFARNNGLEIPSKEQVRKENGLKGDLIKQGTILRIGADKINGGACVPVSLDTVELSKPLDEPAYNPHSRPTSLVESNQPYQFSSSSAIDEQKMAYAGKIFDALVKAGTVKADTKFESFLGFLGGLDQDMAGLISDRDSDGYFDLDTVALRELLSATGALTSPSITADKIKNDLSGVAVRYFDEKLDGNPSIPAGTIDPKMRSMTFTGFEKYLEATYRGRLCGNLSARAAYVEDIKSFVAAHFTGTIEKNAEIDVDDRFIATPENIGKQLSRDRSGRYRADCGVYAQVYKRLFAAAGLATEYYGTYIQPKGYAAGNHLQAVGYLPNEKFILVNNNEELSRHNLNKLPGTAENVVRETLRAAYAGGLKILDITEGQKTQAQVLALLAPSKTKLDTQVLLDDVIGSLQRLEDQQAKALAKHDGYVDHKRLRSVLDALRSKVGRICKNIDTFGTAVLPLTLQVSHPKKGSVERTFRTTAEIKTYIEDSLQGPLGNWQRRLAPQ